MPPLCRELIRALAAKAPKRLPSDIYKRLDQLRIARRRLLKRGSKGFGRGVIPVQVTVRRSADGDVNKNMTRCSAAAAQHAPSASLISILPMTFTSMSSCVLLNCRSVCNKASELYDYICDRRMDFFGLTETWLTGTPEDGAVTAALLPDGYSVVHRPRGSRGGGVALVHRSCITLSQVRLGAHTSFEALDAISGAPCNLRISVVYRPPPSRANNATCGQFMSEFADYISDLVSHPGELLIVGDFNFHMNEPNDPNASIFLNLLTSFGLAQHVRGPTHQSGHTLDLVITRSVDVLIWSTVAYDQCISDHYPVCATLVIPKVLNPTREVSYRRIKAIDKEQLDRLIEASALSSPSENASLNENVTNYQRTLTGILDEVAPLRSRTVRIRVNADWYNDAIRAEKQRRRQAERRWRKSKLPTDGADRELFKEAKNRTQSMIDHAKSLHFQEKVSACSNDPKKLFRVVDTLLGNSTESPLPVHDSRVELATRFSDFFVEKIATIQSAFPSVDN